VPLPVAGLAVGDSLVEVEADELGLARRLSRERWQDRAQESIRNEPDRLAGADKKASMMRGRSCRSNAFAGVAMGEGYRERS